MTTLNILHLSDFHLVKGEMRVFIRGAIFPAFDPDALKAMDSWIEEQYDQGINAILISGDISHVGTPTYLQNALEIFHSNMLPALNYYKKEIPIVLLPGNHDRYLRGAPSFEQIFSSYWSPNSKFVSSWYLPDGNNPSLVIVMADFSLKRRRDSNCSFGFLGQGKVYKDEVRCPHIRN